MAEGREATKTSTLGLPYIRVNKIGDRQPYNINYEPVSWYNNSHIVITNIK